MSTVQNEYFVIFQKNQVKTETRDFEFFLITKTEIKYLYVTFSNKISNEPNFNQKFPGFIDKNPVFIKNKSISICCISNCDSEEYSIINNRISIINVGYVIGDDYMKEFGHHQHNQPKRCDAKCNTCKDCECSKILKRKCNLNCHSGINNKCIKI